MWTEWPHVFEMVWRHESVMRGITSSLAGALMSAAEIYRGVALLRSERAGGAW